MRNNINLKRRTLFYPSRIDRIVRKKALPEAERVLLYFDERLLRNSSQ